MLPQILSYISSTNTLYEYILFVHGVEDITCVFDQVTHFSTQKNQKLFFLHLFTDLLSKYIPPRLE